MIYFNILWICSYFSISLVTNLYLKHIIFFLFSTAACSNFLRIPSKHDDMSPCSLSTREKLSRPYYGTKLQRQHKLFPYLVVKAEVTGTGSPDGAFQLTGFSYWPCFFHDNSSILLLNKLCFLIAIS